jgi:hypothetical protein
MEQDRYSCIVSAIIDMQERGFDADFNLSGDRLLCSQLAMLVGSKDFEVVEMHYFPRSREMACEKMVYGIEVPSCGLRGILISGTNQFTAFPEVITGKLRAYTSRRRVIHSRLL